MSASTRCVWFQCMCCSHRYSALWLTVQLVIYKHAALLRKLRWMESNKEVREALRVRMLGNLSCKGEATDIRPGQQF